MDHQVCYLALFSWVYDMHELMTHPDWTFTGSYSLPGTMPLALSAWPWQKAQMDLQIKFWWVLFQERKPNFLSSYHLHKNKDSIDGLAQDCCKFPWVNNGVAAVLLWSINRFHKIWTHFAVLCFHFGVTIMPGSSKWFLCPHPLCSHGWHWSVSYDCAMSVKKTWGIWAKSRIAE